MNLARALAVAAATAVVVVSIPVLTRLVHAQSALTGPTTPPSGQMMQHMHGMPGPGAQSPMSAEPADQRQLVALPGPMREEMLANMRDHLERIPVVSRHSLHA